MPNSRRSFVSIGVGLIVAVVAIYAGVGSFEFTNYDDPDYVSQNDTVQRGLTLDGIRWAFTTDFMGNWHPLTWLSHMLDCQLFGLNAGAHHWVNVVLHALNTLLLLWVIWQYTGALERSAFVAALFAFHPLHVESVAWIAERKDVLSAFFWLLTMWAWLRYVKARSAGQYLLALLFFALGLMSKPMLVTLPFVLLLLDFWPLRRLEVGAAIPDFRFLRALVPLIIEKTPFFILTIVSCVVTFIVQRKGGAVGSLEKFPFGARVANALVGYVAYIAKAVFPDNLAAFYPHPGSWETWQVVGAIIFLLLIFVTCISFLRTAPYLLTGWLWYLGTLIPVIGLVQVGDQAYADRYTYIPLIGIFVAIVWGVAHIARALRWPIEVMRGIGITGVVICAVISAFQLSHWRDSETLFRHALAVTSRNYVAEYNLGQALSVQGRIDEAVEHYYRALEVKSDHEGAHNNLGLTYAIHGEWTKATNHYAQGLEIAPTNGDIHFNMGIALLTLGDPTNANQHLQWTLKANPRHYLAHKAIGDASLAMKRFRDAADHYRKALHIKADQPEALNRLAWVLSTAPDTTLRNGKEAVQLAERACQLTNYQQPIMLITLATASAEAGDFNRAVDVVRQAETLAMLQGDRFTAERARQLRQEFEQNQPHREL